MKIEILTRHAWLMFLMRQQHKGVLFIEFKKVTTLQHETIRVTMGWFLWLVWQRASLRGAAVGLERLDNWCQDSRGGMQAHLCSCLLLRMVVLTGVGGMMLVLPWSKVSVPELLLSRVWMSLWLLLLLLLLPLMVHAALLLQLLSLLLVLECGAGW